LDEGERAGEGSTEGWAGILFVHGVHKAKELPRKEFKREVERHLTGKETEAWEIIYFKLYKSQLPVVEKALETAGLMLGTEKSRGYCLEKILFQLYYRFFLAAADQEWQEDMLRKLEARYGDLPDAVRHLETPSPNSSETKRFLGEIQPDIILARCKSILNKRIYSQARVGTFVMHPGICPEYRNAHGCFWALANRNTANVGMTLLKIDADVDTGPVYGYYRYDYDEVAESHIVIQNRVVFDNLDSLATKFREILAGTAAMIDSQGRKSRACGQPWLTRYLRWKRAAKCARRRDAGPTP